MDPSDPYSRPARRTQWIVSTLAHHYGLDRGVENEIIVLATGLDQYLQEIFHHMDYRGRGSITAEDFRLLCGVLGLSAAAVDADADTDAAAELPFRVFHARLCGHFSARAGCNYERGRPLVPEENRHIETQIRLRRPPQQRPQRRQRAAQRGAPCGPDCCSSCSRDCYEEIVALEEAEDLISKLEDENASLRELVEDMRAALQSSDARCLALQVGLCKSQSSRKQGSESSCPEWQVPQNQRHKMADGPHVSPKQRQGFTHTAESTREHQDEVEQEEVEGLEVHLSTMRLLEEVQSWREAAASLEERNQVLKEEQVAMRRRVEEARQALLNGLAKVRDLEAKANQVPALQRHALQLESELRLYRSERSRLQIPSSRDAGEHDRDARRPGQRQNRDQHGRRSPTGHTETAAPANRTGGAFRQEGEEIGAWPGASSQDGTMAGMQPSGGVAVEEQLFRSVEGQAASDEDDEDEEKWSVEQQRRAEQLKSVLTRLSRCGDRCEDQALRSAMWTSGSLRKAESCGAVLELLDRVSRLKETQAETNREQMKENLVQELQQKVEETELLQVELQMLETERVRLSLVEEKLLDVLQLLQQLRDLNVSRRSLGKILLSTLESCSDPQHGKAHILEVLNALYHELAACQILSSGGPLQQTQSQQSLNALIISC